MLEAFGVGNLPDGVKEGWLPWLKQQTKAGLKVGLKKGFSWLVCVNIFWVWPAYQGLSMFRFLQGHCHDGPAIQKRELVEASERRSEI